VAAAQDMSQQDRDDMVAGMVAGLAAKLEENPNNPDGWIMLIRSYSVLGDQTKARLSFETAAQCFSNDTDVLTRLKSETAGLF